MLNQSFTTDNFENIYDIESRKQSIKLYLGDGYCDVISKIKLLQSEILEIKRKKIKDRTENDKDELNKKRKMIFELTEKKKNLQHDELEKISETVNSKGFKFELQSKDDNIFVIQNKKEDFFAIKQLQYNIRKTFNIKQGNRHLILSQIKLLLNDNSPKYIIRTDISKFFESILQDKLLKKINENTLLSSQSKKFILQIIEDYNKKKDTTKIEVGKGIPRGIGISSYLSELFLKEIDSQIRNLNDVVYYARYVDDIFIIISPSLPQKCIGKYFIEIKQIVEREGLSLHKKGNKCNLLDLSIKVNSNTHSTLTYLGYQIHIEQKPKKPAETTFGLSQNKVDKIEKRVLQSIKWFNETSKYDIKTSRKSLLLCLYFLTTNTKLSGSKSRVKTGIYYSNDLIDECFLKKDISALDKKLKGKWLKSLSPHSNLFANQQENDDYVDKLRKSIIEKCSFLYGFREKPVRCFSLKEIKTIKMILK